MPHQHGQHREHLHNPTGLTDTAVSQGHDFIEHAEHEEEQVSRQRHEADQIRSTGMVTKKLLTLSKAPSSTGHQEIERPSGKQW